MVDRFHENHVRVSEALAAAGLFFSVGRGASPDSPVWTLKFEPWQVMLWVDKGYLRVVSPLTTDSPTGEQALELLRHNSTTPNARAAIDVSGAVLVTAEVQVQHLNTQQLDTMFAQVAALRDLVAHTMGIQGGGAPSETEPDAT